MKAKKFSQRGFENGVGLVVINSEKGRKLFDSVASDLHVETHGWKEALTSNKSFLQPWPQPVKYKGFWEDYETLDFSELTEKYCGDESAEEALKIRQAKRRSQYYLLYPYFFDILNKVKRRLPKKQ